MPERIVSFENIGDVRIRKNKRSKKISISIRPDCKVSVTLPYYVSYSYGLKIIEQKRLWIEEHLEKMKLREQQTVCFNEDSNFKTSKRTLSIRSHKSDKVKTIIHPDVIHVFYPENHDVNSKEIQDTIKAIIVKALRLEAKEFLPLRTAELANKYNFRYKQIFIKNNKTLWGSCSGRNNINLNLHLMRLPLHLIDYVIIHELCHTVEKNHGPRFWNLMDSILGNAKKLSKELKNHRINFLL